MGDIASFFGKYHREGNIIFNDKKEWWMVRYYFSEVATKEDGRIFFG
jgi:hypothetical protein